MDTFARGLRAAAKLVDDGVLAGAVKDRYASYDSGLGAKIERGESSLEELEVCVCMWRVCVCVCVWMGCISVYSMCVEG